MPKTKEVDNDLRDEHGTCLLPFVIKNDFENLIGQTLADMGLRKRCPNVKTILGPSAAPCRDSRNVRRP